MLRPHTEILRRKIGNRGKRGRSLTVELLPLCSGFVGGNYFCDGSKERWLRTVRVVLNMYLAGFRTPYPECFKEFREFV